jgi:predicted DNA-binding transcriptional regulator YafY
MAKDTFITRFSLIIKRLERGPASFEQLASYLEQESHIQDRNFSLSIRTLQRDIRHIYEQFNIEIANERKGDRRYYIKNRPEDTEHSQRLLEAYDLVHLVQQSNQYSRYVFFEQRKPRGLENFAGLLHACSQRRELRFSYYKFWNESATERTVHPLALKEALGRWYLLAVDTRDGVLKSFGLDRIQHPDISKTSFRGHYPYNLQQAFYYAFGIINEVDKKPQKVVLSLSREQGLYLVNYPLHPTQQIVEDSRNGIRLQLEVLITFDLVMALQSYGPYLKVESPKSLQRTLKEQAKKVLALYS